LPSEEYTVASRPVNRTALRAEENLPRAGQPAGQRQRGDRPHPVQPRGQNPGPGQVPRGVQQLPVHRVQVLVQGGEHVQRGGDRAHFGQALLGAQPAPTQLPGALVEQHRVDALGPGGVLDPKVAVQLQRRPALQHMARRDPALGQPPVGKQLPQVPRVGPVCLRVPLPTAQRGGVGRLADMRDRPGRREFLGHIPTAGTPLQRELDVVAAGEPPRQPAGQMRPVGRGDLTTLQLAGIGVDIVEGDLLPMDVRSSYDGHRDLLKLPGTRKRPVRQWLTQPMMSD
jgi:hypothetical protein